VLVNITPIFSVLVSSFLFKIKPSRMAILGLAVSLVGVLVIVYTEAVFSGADARLGGFSLGLKGDLEAVLAALVESFYLNFGSKLRSETELLPTMLPVYLLTAFFVGILSVPTGSAVLALPAQGMSVLALIGLGILPTAVAHTLYFSSLSNLKSFETATMALLEPVGATMLGIAFFQEVPAWPFAFGAFFVLLGVFFVVRNRS
jgi:drug/metabolite transporter (DMT)-like permease